MSLKNELINSGYQNFINVNKIVSVARPDSAPIKRTINDAADKGLLIDLTMGHRTRSVLFMDSGHIVLSALQPETIAERIGKE